MAEKICMYCIKKFDESLDICPHCGKKEGFEQEKPYFLKPGTVLCGKYAIGRAVGYGGFGITYAAYDLALEKKVAVKEFFPTEYATRELGRTVVTSYGGNKAELYEKGVEKFADEARRLAKFKDTEGVVSVFDSFKENNTAYIVMEFLEGRSMKDFILNRKSTQGIPASNAIKLMLPVLNALSALHSENLIHRDISPDNIFMTNDGKIKLIDFGAARFVDNDEKSLSIILKHGFAPPEQYRKNGNQGPWTDVYACAATLYLLICGTLPGNALDREVKDELKTPSQLGIKMDKNQENALMNALNLPVEKRTQSAAQFIKELNGEVQAERVAVKNEKKDCGKTPLWLKLSLGVILIAVVAFAVLFATGVLGGKKDLKEESSLGKNQVRVPNVVNMEIVPARTKLEETPLLMQISDKDHSDEIPKNYVLSQSVESGKAVEKNALIDLTISAGILKDHVPFVLGKSKDDAARELTGLSVGSVIVLRIEEQVSAAARGMVVSQSLEKGSVVKKDDEITIVVSSGIDTYDPTSTTTVPDFTGSGWEECLDRAEDSHVYVYIKDAVYTDEVPLGEVLSQDAKEGSEVNEAKEIGLTVSLGKETVYVPDVQYKDKDEAVKTLEEAGLKAEFKEIESEIVANNHVIEQDIEEDSEVEAGSTIRLYVSDKVDETDEEPDFEGWEAEEPKPTPDEKTYDTPEPTEEPTSEPTEEPTAEPTEEPAGPTEPVEFDTWVWSVPSDAFEFEGHYYYAFPYGTMTEKGEIETACRKTGGRLAQMSGSHETGPVMDYFDSWGIPMKLQWSGMSRTSNGELLPEGAEPDWYYICEWDPAEKYTTEVPADALFYGGHRYYIFSNEINWMNEGALCKAHGGHLAIIEDEGENNAIFEYILSHDPNQYTRVFFGLRYNAAGRWEWADGTALNYTNWEKDHFYYKDKYAYACFQNFKEGYWSSWEDPNDNCWFICEWDGDETPVPTVTPVDSGSDTAAKRIYKDENLAIDLFDEAINGFHVLNVSPVTAENGNLDKNWINADLNEYYVFYGEFDLLTSLWYREEYRRTDGYEYTFRGRITADGREIDPSDTMFGAAPDRIDTDRGPIHKLAFAVRKDAVGDYRELNYFFTINFEGDEKTERFRVNRKDENGVIGGEYYYDAS